MVHAPHHMRMTYGSLRGVASTGQRASTQRKDRTVDRATAWAVGVATERHLTLWRRVVLDPPAQGGMSCRTPRRQSRTQAALRSAQNTPL